jgi:uncharacterized phiE125 gp8 family phage protein
MQKKDKLSILKIIDQRIWSLDAIKNYMRISHDYDDELICGLINTAITSAENFTALSLKIRQVELKSYYMKRNFDLYYDPIQRIQKITITLGNQEKQINEESYELVNNLLAVNDNHKFDSIVMQYLTGFENDQIPEPIKQGILLHVSEMYDREEKVGALFVNELRTLYSPYRQIRI